MYSRVSDYGDAGRKAVAIDDVVFDFVALILAAGGQKASSCKSRFAASGGSGFGLGTGSSG